VILCIGHIADNTFRYTVSRFAELGMAFDAIDLNVVALCGEVTSRSNARGPVIQFYLPNDNLIATDNYNAVYSRVLDTSTAAPNPTAAHRAFAQFQVVTDILDRLQVLVINRPRPDLSNVTKIFHQTRLSELFELRVPRSIVTTEPSAALEFIQHCKGGTIIKGASARKTWASAIEESEAASRLLRISDAPSLIQERIYGNDLRVHVVGHECWAEAIEGDTADYRNATDLRASAFSLPNWLAEKCIDITEFLGLSFAGVDFKIEASSGDFVFLEANSMPCYQGYDRRTDGAISLALCKMLGKQT
jgi:glutathione synthase/RimK-type ligase-like ATP-grasp enzyme